MRRRVSLHRGNLIGRLTTDAVLSPDLVLRPLEHLLQAVAANRADLSLGFLAVDQHDEARNLRNAVLLRQLPVPCGVDGPNRVAGLLVAMHDGFHLHAWAALGRPEI